MNFFKRKFAKAEIDKGEYLENKDYEPATEETGNLVTSKLETWKGNFHAPVLDIDVPHTLVPSSTEGHSHLYIDVECDWEDYKRFLRAAAKIGLLEDGFVNASLERGFTSVRKPGVKKPAPEKKASIWW